MKGGIILGYIVFLTQHFTLTGADPVGSCPLSNGEFDVLLPDDRDCHYFYKCNWGAPIRLDCFGDLQFDYKIHVCNYPGQAECYSEPNPEGPAGGGSGSGDDSDESWNNACTSNVAQLYYPDTEDCQSFYICTYGTAHHITCPEGTLYNAALMVCDHPGNVRCSEKPQIVSPEPIDPDDGGNGGNGDGGNGDGGGEDSGESWTEACTIGNTQVYYPDPEDCQCFYMCEFGNLKHMSCPNGTLYNAALLICDYPENVRCSQTPELVDPEPIDPEGGGGDNGSGENNGNGAGDGDDGDSGESWTEACTIGSSQVYYPDPEDCQCFYMCEFGNLKHVTCPNGTLYNAALLICDHPENVRCSQKPVIVEPIDPEGGDDGAGSGGNANGEGNGEDSGESWTDPCTVDSKQLFFPDPENCQCFYVCDFGHLEHMTCPEGTLYNAALLVCDYPGNVRCSETPQMVNPEPVESKDQDANESHPWKCTEEIQYEYYADPKMCDGYYICSYGTLKHHICANGTLYNSITKMCDHPNNVKCSDNETSKRI